MVDLLTSYTVITFIEWSRKFKAAKNI